MESDRFMVLQSSLRYSISFAINSCTCGTVYIIWREIWVWMQWSCDIYVLVVDCKEQCSFDYLSNKFFAIIGRLFYNKYCNNLYGLLWTMEKGKETKAILPFTKFIRWECILHDLFGSYFIRMSNTRHSDVTLLWGGHQHRSRGWLSFRLRVGLVEVVGCSHDLACAGASKLLWRNRDRDGMYEWCSGKHCRQ
jgi:hypothetical protein